MYAAARASSVRCIRASELTCCNVLTPLQAGLLRLRQKTLHPIQDVGGGIEHLDTPLVKRRPFRPTERFLSRLSDLDQRRTGMRAMMRPLRRTRRTPRL